MTQREDFGAVGDIPTWQAAQAAQPVQDKTCQHCKHWWESTHEKRHCSNDSVIGMLSSYEAAWFEPPADFCCNKWEGKV